MARHSIKKIDRTVQKESSVNAGPYQEILDRFDKATEALAQNSKDIEGILAKFLQQELSEEEKARLSKSLEAFMKSSDKLEKKIGK